MSGLAHRLVQPEILDGLCEADPRAVARRIMARMVGCQARLVDEMHLAIAPRLLGSGEHLMTGLDLPALGYACTKHVASDKATHVIVTRRT